MTQLCKVCKQEITVTDQTIEDGTIHKNGACDTYFNEQKKSINESNGNIDDLISETQLL